MFYRKLYNNLAQKSLLSKIYPHQHRNFVANVKRERYSRDIILSTLENSQINSTGDWTTVRKAILEHEYNRGQYSSHNIDAIIMGHCAKTRRYDLAASYIEFLNKENIKPNLATVGKYLSLIYLNNIDACIETGKSCDRNIEEEIVSYYDAIRTEYPVLDSFTLDHITQALSLTSRWKECVDLLEEIKISAVGSGNTYSAVATSAFLNREEELGWKLLNEMLGYDKAPQSIVYLAYINLIKIRGKKKDKLEKLEKLFSFLQDNNLKFDEAVAACVSELARTLGFHTSKTTVLFKGTCKNCSQTLRNFELTDEEFFELKNKIFENVIVGRDVFIKTTPEELEQFKDFTETMGRFDIVVDGLNVAYSMGTKHSPHVISALVASVVSHFVQKRNKVLVLGRVHMDRWPQKNWGYVRRNATVFLAENISQDDPYLLYCALNSGKNTVIVTRDLMRGHKFLLKEPRLKMLFNRWLSQRQYQLVRVDDVKGPIFRIPPPFSTIAQRSNGIWHVPYETENKTEFHRTWLCLKAGNKT